MDMGDSQNENNWKELREKIHSEIEQYRKDEKEIALMLEQSQLEVNKYASRNASIMAHIQQIQTQFDTLPRADIRMAYESALDTQQRLFVMRGQVEKLQSDYEHIRHYAGMMDEVTQLLDGGDYSFGGAGPSKRAAETVEMLIQAQEEERQRLSRQMHDGPAQALSNFILQTEIAIRLFDLDTNRAKEELAELKESVTTTFRKVRDFIFELRPMMLDDLGLIPTLRRYVEAHKEQTGIDIRLAVTGTEHRLEDYQEVMIFRAVQELINNAHKHSQATEIKIHVDMGDVTTKVTVDDDGKGFDSESISERSGMGLKVIQDRVEMLRGNMTIDAVVEEGTRISFQIPTAIARV